MKDIFDTTQRIKVLKEEIKYARTQIKPNACGHVYTAIHWMERRIEELEKLPHFK